MKENIKLFKASCFIVGIAWIVVGLAVVYGLYLTNNPKCLWGLAIPLFLGRPSLSYSSEEEDEEE